TASGGRVATLSCPGVPVNHTFHVRLPFDPTMLLRWRRGAMALIAAALLALSGLPGLAQGNEPKPQDQKAPSGEPSKDQKTIDEFDEASRVLGGPAANPECVWLGRRVIIRMWQDDLDTAFRHLDLYDRFGCPGGHIQAAFRCLLRLGLGAKAPDLNS